jgi:hypothetical protein
LLNRFIAKKESNFYNKILKMNVDFTSKVAIIYPTKDDFVEKAFEKLLNINYKNADIYILDDSVEKGYKDKIDKFNNRCTILRR